MYSDTNTTGSAVELDQPVKGLPLLGSALSIRDGILDFFTDLAAERGDLASFHMGRNLWVLASSAESVATVLQDKDKVFEKPDAVYGPGRLLFGGALTGLKGDRWKERRSKVAPAFHRQGVDAAGAAKVVDTWLQSNAGRGETDLSVAIKSLMFEVAAIDVLGPDAALGVELVGPVGDALDAMGARVRMGVPVPDWMPIAPVKKMRSAVGTLHEEIDSVRRRRSGGATDDLLGKFMESGEDGSSLLTDRQIRDEAAVLVAVGGNQLSLAMIWTLALLAENPVAARILQREIDDTLDGNAIGLETLPKLRFAAATIEESMRLFPPFFMFAREATRATVVSGRRVPKGATLILSPWVTHRDPEHFERPESFEPQRWTPEFVKQLPTGAYFPTGGGPRLCVANSALRKYMVLVLVSILREHRVDITGYSLEPLATTVLQMRGELTGRIESRQP